MGIAKEKAIKSQALGFTEVGNKFVCCTCISDKALRKAIKLAASSKACSYCKSTKNKNIAAPVDQIIAIILEGLNYEWANPLNELLYISAEGGWQGKIYDSWDLTELIQEEAEIEHVDLIDDIRTAFSDIQWCKPNGLSWEDALSFSWKAFVKYLTCRYRYTFFEISDDVFEEPYEDRFRSIPPKKFLHALSQIINSHKNLVLNIPENKEIFRIRWFTNQPDINLHAKDLGTPPVSCATVTNRMSPPGIPIFYGALDEETALRETVKEKEASYAVIAKFKTLKPIKVLNLSDLPMLPSLFDKKNRDLRDAIRFLKQFSNEVSRHIERDGREHTEYVPTQVLSEYFRHIFKYKKKNIDGIFYGSSKNEVGVCCALFVENEGCINPNENLSSATLQLVEIHRRSLPSDFSR